MSGLDYRHAIYAGSFDPITLGHTAIIHRALRLYDKVTVAIGVNPKKGGLFSQEERLALIISSLPAEVRVVAFKGLLVDFARSIGAGVLVRGLRLLADFEHEFQLALANRDVAPDIETMFLMTEPNHVYVSSSLIKEIAMNGGDTSRYVPPAVHRALNEKYAAKP
ncbi:MAG: pantetheine-phosphate adenylyltransferase [Myxococcota bacterium]